MPTSFTIFKHLSNYEYAMLGYKTNSELKKILFMTLPKQSLVLTSTDRSDIDKVLQALVGKVGMNFKTNELENLDAAYLTWYDDCLIFSSTGSRAFDASRWIETADTFLAYFEKPTEIQIKLNNGVAIVMPDCVAIDFENGANVIYTKELNQIVNAQKELNLPKRKFQFIDTSTKVNKGF